MRRFHRDFCALYGEAAEVHRQFGKDTKRIEHRGDHDGGHRGDYHSRHSPAHQPHAAAVTFCFRKTRVGARLIILALNRVQRSLRNVVVR